MLKSKRGRFSLRTAAIAASLLAIAVAGLGLSGGSVTAQNEEAQFTTEFRLADCAFKATGANPYFILKPGYQLELEGEEDGETTRVVITVLADTENISLPDIGRVRTRVVEEKEWVDDELVEVSRNFFAICDKTNDVFYFGEDVDIFNPDGTVSHEGAWRAGEPDDEGLAQPGLIMPGTFLLGSRYFQEVADGIALDRAEHVALGLEVTTAAGTFDQCVGVLETTPLEPGAESEKVYCPGVGLVVDDVVELVAFGFNDDDDDD
ncbi:MAG TPA: hypothetical protein VJG32_19160 [Anaerolineae bacterium]|nr:hypothetical protein [Anaerolineae bacterium]